MRLHLLPSAIKQQPDEWLEERQYTLWQNPERILNHEGAEALMQEFYRTRINQPYSAWSVHVYPLSATAFAGMYPACYSIKGQGPAGCPQHLLKDITKFVDDMPLKMPLEALAKHMTIPPRPIDMQLGKSTTNIEDASDNTMFPCRTCTNGFLGCQGLPMCGDSGWRYDGTQ